MLINHNNALLTRAVKRNAEWNRLRQPWSDLNLLPEAASTAHVTSVFSGNCVKASNCGCGSNRVLQTTVGGCSAVNPLLRCTSHMCADVKQFVPPFSQLLLWFPLDIYSRINCRIPPLKDLALCWAQDTQWCAVGACCVLQYLLIFFFSMNGSFLYLSVTPHSKLCWTWHVNSGVFNPFQGSLPFMIKIFVSFLFVLKKELWLILLKLVSIMLAWMNRGHGNKAGETSGCHENITSLEFIFQLT